VCCSSVQCTVLYSVIVLSREPVGIGHMCIYTFLLRVADIMTSQNIDLPSWDTLYYVLKYFIGCTIIDFLV
jgi:hypothetical protein